MVQNTQARTFITEGEVDKAISFRPVSLRDWQRMIDAIYRKKDGRDYSDADLLLHIVEENAKVDEGLRKDRQDEILQALPRVFIWLLSFCSRLGIDAENALWSKYPSLCPYCGAKEHCFCISKTDTSGLPYFRSDDVQPSSLSEYQAMFLRLYGRVNRLLSKTAVWLHFHEELGEVSRAFRFRDADGQITEEELRLEIADAFAWLFAFCNRLNIQLDDLAFEAYPGVCDVCRNPHCTCPKV